MAAGASRDGNDSDGSPFVSRKSSCITSCISADCSTASRPQLAVRYCCRCDLMVLRVGTSLFDSTPMICRMASGFADVKPSRCTASSKRRCKSAVQTKRPKRRRLSSCSTSSLLLPLPLLLQSDPSLECSPRFGRELVCVRRAGELKLSQSVAEDEEDILSTCRSCARLHIDLMAKLQDQRSPRSEQSTLGRHTGEGES